MEKKKRIVEILVCLGLTVSIWAVYFCVKPRIDSLKNERIANQQYYSGDEFVRTIDCAQVIDENGLENMYRIEFEMKAAKPGVVTVCLQNGYKTKYSLFEYVDVTEEFQHYEFICKIELWDDTADEAYLSFHGNYGTGIVPTIKNVSFGVYRDSER